MATGRADRNPAADLSAALSGSAAPGHKCPAIRPATALLIEHRNDRQLRVPARVVMRQDHCSRIDPQSFLDHLARVHRGAVDRATEHLLIGDQPMLGIQEQDREDLVLEPAQLDLQTAPDSRRRIELDSPLHLLVDGIARRLQDLLRRRQQVIALAVADVEQDSKEERTVATCSCFGYSGGIARNRPRADLSNGANVQTRAGHALTTDMTHGLLSKVYRPKYCADVRGLDRVGCCQNGLTSATGHSGSRHQSVPREMPSL